jgi:hypothetical protein
VKRPFGLPPQRYGQKSRTLSGLFLSPFHESNALSVTSRTVCNSKTSTDF